MRILHIIDEPYDSGIVQYALKAAEGLMRRGHACRVWGLKGCYPLLEARRRGIGADGYSHPWLNLAVLRRSLRIQGLDLVVAHTGSAHTLAVAAAAWHRGPGTRRSSAASSSASGPVPADGGGGYLPVVRTRGDARPQSRRPGGRLLWSRTSGFVAANRRILDEHSRLYGRPDLHAAVVYEGREDPGPPRPPARGAPTVGIVARLDPVKGHRCFLEAAARVLRECPDARFLVVGRQENVRAADLLGHARRLGLADRLDLTGHVPDALEFMRRCHVGVVASTGSEAVSRSAVEWMAVGRPLVATKVGCLPEYVIEGETGFLVPPGDAPALARATGRLVRDAFLRERMGQAGRRRYESRFTLERFLDETERLYGETIHAVPSR
ncbi:MAG: glycosyltransferase family 4 protein [Elusimicrobiota bacterium]